MGFLQNLYKQIQFLKLNSWVLFRLLISLFKKVGDGFLAYCKSFVW